MAQRESLTIQPVFSIDELAKLREEDFTEGAITFEYRDTNGAMVLARKGDHVKRKLTQQQLAEMAKVSSREVNLIETFREYSRGKKDRKDYIQRQLAMALRVKKGVFFPLSSEVYTRSSRQPAKLRILLTKEEAYKRSRLLLHNLRGNAEDRVFMEKLKGGLEEKRWYFKEIFTRHGPVIHNDLMLLMDIPEVIVEKANAIAESGGIKWALDKLNVAENRVVFMYDKRGRNRLEEIAKNYSIITDNPEIIRLRMVYGLENEINKLPRIEASKTRSLGKPFTSLASV